jgi:hypothetical protein
MLRIDNLGVLKGHRNMAPHPTLHIGFERLIGTAAVDHSFGADLLRNPQGTALKFGLAAKDAALVADIQARDLRTFASILLPRLYGKAVTHATRREAVAG